MSENIVFMAISAVSLVALPVNGQGPPLDVPYAVYLREECDLYSSVLTDNRLIQSMDLPRNFKSNTPAQYAAFLPATLDDSALKNFCSAFTRCNFSGMSLECQSTGPRLSLELTADGISSLGSVSELTYLSLRGVHLGKLPYNDDLLEQCSSMTHLRHLDISNTKNVSRKLGRLANNHRLECLNLNGTNFGDFQAEELRGVSSLTKLGCRGAQISKVGLENLLALPNLTALDISYTRLNAVLCRMLANTGSITNINLNDTGVGDEEIIVFQERRNITHFSAGGLNHSAVSDRGIKMMAAWPSLRSLDLSRSEVSDSGVANILGDSIEELILDGTTIGEHTMRRAGKLPCLRVLSVTGTQIDDDSLLRFRDAQKIKELYLRDTQVSNRGMSIIDTCKCLSVLDLGGTNIGDEGLSSLGQMPNLTRVYLDNTKVGTEGVRALRSASPGLAVLVLDGSRISSDAIRIIRSWPKLWWLDIRKTACADDKNASALFDMRSLTLLQIGLRDSRRAPRMLPLPLTLRRGESLIIE